jgi:hypothetical protein
MADGNETHVLVKDKDLEIYPPINNALAHGPEV